MSIVDAERWVTVNKRGTVTVYRGAPWRNDIIAEFGEADREAVKRMVTAHNHMLTSGQIAVSTRVDL